MGSLMRAFDWSKTVIGPVASWPQSLKTAVRIILTSRYAMFVWWGRELINLYNDPYRVFLGVKHPDALGKSARDVWAEIWEQIGPRTDAVLLRGESTFDEALLLLMERHGYLEETYFTFSYSPLPDDQGNVGGLFCAVTEETQRVIGERRLTLLRDMASEMAGSLTPGRVCKAAARSLSRAQRDLPFSLIYLFDSDGRTLRKVSYAGIDRDHPALPDKIVLDDSEGSIWQFRAAMELRGPVLIENLDEHIPSLPRGEWSHAPKNAVVAAIAHQGQTRPAGVLVAGLNPHRKFDQEFKGFVSLLANQIAAAIANAVAYETERSRAEALAELDRSKTLFFSNVSHEFRTPLTLMLGPIEDLLGKERNRLPAEDQEQLGLAHRNALKLLKLVNTLLDFSRIEAGRAQAVYKLTDLSRLTVEIASVFRSAMQKAGLHYSIDCEPLPEPVYVDREMWEKIVLNLLSNAFKFTFEGGIAITLKEENGVIELSVRDTGVGIPADEMPHVFERFHRIEGARARTYEGTGIGLALVRELVKLHGGDVRVESEVNCGSRFVVSIPGTMHFSGGRTESNGTMASPTLAAEAYVDEAERWLLPEACPVNGENAPDPVSSPIELAAPHADEKELILVVDDNADMRDYLCHLLRDEYRVRAVPDGVHAVEAIRQFHPALLLTDMMMPGLDGFGLVRAIRNDSSISSTPVILLSARAGEDSRVEGLQAGADDYLVKPFTARELLARVAAHVRMANLRRVATQREAQLRKTVEISEERLRLAQTAAQIGTWEWNPVESTQTLSEDLHRILGTEASDPNHAQEWATRVHPNDWPKVQQLMEQANQSGKVEFEYRYRHPERGLRWFYCKGRRLQDEPRMFGVLLDITDRKRAELRSAVQQRVNRAFAESSDLPEAASQILRAVCEVLDWNVGCFWMLEPHAGNLRAVEVFCSPEDRGRNFARASQSCSFAKGIGLPGRVWLSGQPHWIADVTADTNFPRSGVAGTDGLHAAFGFPVLAQGQIMGVLEFLSQEIRPLDDDLLQMMASIGVQMDQYIQRVQAEQERYRLAAIVASSDDAIIGKDLNGIVTSWNASAERIFGYKQDEMIGRSIIQIIPPDLHSDEQRILETLRRGERIDHFETVRMTKSGERIEVSLTISPIKDQTGKIIGVAKIARDITQRKRTEQALRTTERLASVGRLAATVAHEINNPLEAVTNLVYLAKGTPDKQTAETYLAQAQEELDRVSHLTKQTLGFYRETKGAVPIQIGSFLAPLLVIFSSKTRSRGIHVQTEIRQVPEIMAVPGEIRQLLANILSNSIDALDGGGQIRIRVSSAIERRGQYRAGVRITIADSGMGIPESIRTKLFEPFFTTKKDVGTGLGLWICKSIIEKHGGSIRVKSSVTPGRSWTAFSLFLPLDHSQISSPLAVKQAV